jgi:hypothetical protein
VRWALISLLGLTCHDSAEQRVYVDSGALCLRASGDQLRAEVKLLDCVTSSCNRQVAGSCNVSQHERQLSIASRLVLQHEKTRCATDCSNWTLRCEIPAPSPGSYDVVFGTARASLAFPLERDTELVADGSSRPCAAEEPELGVSPQM